MEWERIKLVSAGWMPPEVAKGEGDGQIQPGHVLYCFVVYKKCLALHWWCDLSQDGLTRLPNCLSATMNGVFVSKCSRSCYFEGLVASVADLAERAYLVNCRSIQNAAPLPLSI